MNKALESNFGTRVNIEGRQYLYFGGTNYLSMAQRPELKESFLRAFELYGMSTSASRLTSGETDLLLGLEDELARFFSAESSLTLPAGFMANQALVEALDNFVDAYIQLSPSHSSISSALAMSKKPVYSLESVKQIAALRNGELKNCGASALFIEPIDALSGEILNLSHIIDSFFFDQAPGKRNYLVLDEAQSAGVLGKSGKGALEHFAIEANEFIVRTGTFSKAFGAYGGYILASAQIIAAVKEFSPAFRGSTSMPPPICAAARTSLAILRENPESCLEILKEKLGIMNMLLSERGCRKDFSGHQTAIYYLEHLNEATGLHKILFENGIFLPSIKSYFLGSGAEPGLRFTLQAMHSKGDLEKLARLLS